MKIEKKLRNQKWTHGFVATSRHKIKLELELVEGFFISTCVLYTFALFVDLIKSGSVVLCCVVGKLVESTLMDWFLLQDSRWSMIYPIWSTDTSRIKRVSVSDMYRVGKRHHTDTYNYTELCNFLKLLSVSTCLYPYRVRCLYP
jgi:hypothetical protein